jgi:hypothetical protein
MAYNQCPFFLSLTLKRGGDNHEGKADDVQHIFRQLSFLKRKKGVNMTYCHRKSSAYIIMLIITYGNHVHLPISYNIRGAIGYEL